MGNAQSVSVAIVGAGPGGLAAAMLLASSGARVEVYEAHERIGGRTARISLGEYHFDRGPTFFLMPYVLDEIFAATGRRLSDYAELTRLDPMYRLVMAREGQSDLTIDCTQDVAEMSKRLAAIDPRDGAAFAKFLGDNRAKLRAFEPVLRSPYRSMADLIDPKLVKAGPHLSPGKSVHAMLGKYFSSPYTKLAMSFQTKYLGMSPFSCPSLFTILPYIEYEYGVWHPRGGCNALMTAMAEACVEMGVKIHTGAPVQRLTFDGPRVRGVVVGGVERRADHVVMNADAAWALKNLVPASNRASWSNAKLDKMGYSCSTAMLYLGIKGKVDLAHHTIRIAADYKKNIDQIAVTMELSDDPSVYVCNPTRTDETLAPKGDSALYVLVPTPNQKSGIDWNDTSPKGAAALTRERALDRISALIGEDIRPRIVRESAITPAGWAADNIAFGATFNLAHNLTQMLCFRPQHHLPDTKNLWLVGGGTHPGSGLPVIFLSSQITARLLCEESGLAMPRPRSVHERVMGAGLEDAAAGQGRSGGTGGSGVLAGAGSSGGV
ncbi:MAG: phytoene desaturase [Phycisphaerales bacterium]|nr:phytoene desaturase [Phycisphaerales bacterium]